VVILALLLGWIIAGRVLAPLRTVIAATRDISEHNLHQRLAIDGPEDELKQLGDTIDAVLLRLDRAFDTQRRFVANASHELRTPVALACTLLEMIIGDPRPTVESILATCEDILQSERTQAHRIDALLTLAQSQTGLAHREPVDLDRITERLLIARGEEISRRGLRVHAQLAEAATTGAPHLVESLIANLIDNALRHNMPDGAIDVVTRTTGKDAGITVANTGPVIPAEAVADLFQPFHRLGTDRTTHDESIGLGLSIVQSIAEAHHARIDARPRPGGGLQITVSFAAAEAACATAGNYTSPAPQRRRADEQMTTIPVARRIPGRARR
jgi:signal transduction histidine kinase